MKFHKKYLLISFSLLLVISCNNTEKTTEIVGRTERDNTYDKELALKYGADEYGMKKYILAFLYRGENTHLSQDSTTSLQMAHLKNIRRMAEEGKLVLAGPFFGNDDLRGIYIFNVESLEEAETLTNSDPAIKAGTLRMELKEWYGTAGIMELNNLHHKLEKKSFAD